MPKLVYREYQPDDAEKLCRLHESVFGVPRTPEFWHWKYGANPAGSDLTCVAEDADTQRIVGEHGLIPLRVGVQGEPILACQSVDILVEEDYRHHLVHIEIMMRSVDRVLATGEKYAFVFAFGEPVTIKVSRALLGFDTVAPIPRMAKPLSLEPHVPRALRGLARVADPVFRLAVRPRVARPPGGATMERVLRFDARYDQFWRRQAVRYPVAIWRDSAYLNWRYIEPPGGGYEAYALERQGEILGFVVLRGVSVEGRRRGRILELVADDDEEAIAASLLSHALSRFREQRFAAAVGWAFAGDPLWGTMRRFGFLARPREGRDLVVRNVSNAVSADFVTDPAHWRLSMGDSDEI